MVWPSAQVRVLGRVEVVGPRGQAALIGTKQRAVLAILALNAGTVVPQWRLIDALWGEPPPRTAVKSLQSHIARVRSALAACGLPEVVATREAGYALTLFPEAVDVWRFEECVRRARAALAQDAVEEAAAYLRDGLALWRNDVALSDADVTGWAEAEKGRLSEVRLTAIEDWWDAQLRMGRHDEAVGELDRLLVIHPTREKLVGLSMLALYRCDRQAAALQTFQRLRARLADDLGADPGPELNRLHARILRGDLDLLWIPGHHAVAPPSQLMPRPAQLPARAGHFTGRAAELANLDTLVKESALDGAAGEVQVAVISGPAGIGKTALAVQWAHRMADHFSDGQVFIDLQGHERDNKLTPSDALSRILRSLGVPADRIPADVTEQASLYRSLLRSRRILIVLDNVGCVEDILPLVPADSANLLLVTSRNTLTALAIDHAMCRIGLDVLGHGEAIALLGKLLGTHAIDREPSGAADLVRLCDRMPLAVRIAAAKLVNRVDSTDRPIAELVNELAGANRLDALAINGGSRSVRAVFASAYRALETDAARLFGLLGLHPGPTISLHLAAAVADVAPSEVRELADTLINAHLLAEVAPARLRMHDLVTLFAHRCATVDQSAQTRQEAVARMFDWYLAVASATNRIVDPGRDRVTPNLRYPIAELPFAEQPQAALAFLDGERGNLISIARLATESGRPEVAWQLTYLLTNFYDACGHWHERVELCHVGVAAAQATGDLATEGLMRSALGVAFIATRRFDEALHTLHMALPLMRASADMRGMGHVYNNIAAAHSGLRQFGEAINAFRQALEVHTQHGHRLGIALALNNTGHTYVRMGQPDLGGDDLARALKISREIANRRLEGAALHSLGEAGLRAGSSDEALGYFNEALLVYQEMGDRQYQAETLLGLGLAYLSKGEPAAAIDHLQQALELTRGITDQHLEAVIRHGFGRAYLHAGDLPAARAQLDIALSLRAWVPDAYEEAHLHRDLGDLLTRTGDIADAEQAWKRAIRLYQKVNAVEEANQLAAHLPKRRAASPAAVTKAPAYPDRP